MRGYRAFAHTVANVLAISLFLGLPAALAQAGTPADENLSFSVELSETTSSNPPVGETAYGHIKTLYPNFTSSDSPMGSMKATLLIDGAPAGQTITPFGESALSIGSFLGRDRFKINVTRQGTYAALVTGSYTYKQGFNFITRQVNVVVPLFTTASGKVPAKTGVSKVTGPRNLAFTTRDYRDYNYKFYVQDRDHALDHARIDDVYIPQREWKRTSSGWVIPYNKTVAPASPYEYKRLPNVYRSKIVIALNDKELEQWQVRRADYVVRSFPITFRK
jgi:hypothetical protein